MIKKIWKRFLNRVVRDKKGFLDSFGIGGGYSSQTSKTARPEFVQAPDYAEAEGARKTWWDRLQQWGGMPGYGAISPDWGDIWQQASQKIRDYYWGTPTQSGAINKVKASAARRNVSESPALEKNIAAMSTEEAGKLTNLSKEQAIQQALFGEQGRQTWLQSLMGLSQVNPQGTWWSPWSKQSGFKLSGNIGGFF